MNQFRTLLAKNLKRARADQGMTQQELAESCGLSTNYLATIEIGGKFPSAESLERLISALGLKPYQLFIDEDDVEAFDRQELILRFSERAKRQAAEAIDLAVAEFNRIK